MTRHHVLSGSIQLSSNVSWECPNHGSRQMVNDQLTEINPLKGKELESKETDGFSTVEMDRTVVTKWGPEGFRQVRGGCWKGQYYGPQKSVVSLSPTRLLSLFIMSETPASQSPHLQFRFFLCLVDCSNWVRISRSLLVVKSYQFLLPIIVTSLVFRTQWYSVHFSNIIIKDLHMTLSRGLPFS